MSQSATFATSCYEFQNRVFEFVIADNNKRFIFNKLTGNFTTPTDTVFMCAGGYQGQQNDGASGGIPAPSQGRLSAPIETQKVIAA